MTSHPLANVVSERTRYDKPLDHIYETPEANGIFEDQSSLDERVQFCLKTANCILPVCSGNRDLDHATQANVSLVIQLAAILALRYRKFDQIADIRHEIALLEIYHATLPEGHDLHTEVTHLLGEALINRYKALQDEADLTRAITLHQMLQDTLTTQDGTSHWILAGGLGIALIQRHRKFDTYIDLTQALTLLKEALRCCPTHSMRRGQLVSNLADALLYWYESEPQNKLPELEEACALCKQALLCSLGPRERRESLLSLTKIFLHLFYRSDDAANLDEAIKHAESALDLYSDGWVGRMSTANYLGIALYHRYMRTGARADIDRGAYVLEKALEVCDCNALHRATLLNTYATILNARHEVTQNVDDLEACLEAGQECAKLAPPGHPRRAMVLNNIGIHLMARFHAFGESGDLDAAIDAFQESADLIGRGTDVDIEYHKIGMNLPSIFVLRFTKFGNPRDLSRAVELYEEYLQDIKKRGKTFSDRDGYESIGEGLFALYRQTHQADHLNRCIIYYNNALELSPPSYFFRAQILQALVHARMARSHHESELIGDDVHVAEKLQQEALQLAPSGHPSHVLVTCGLARLCLSPNSSFYSINDALDAVMNALSEPRCTAQKPLQEITTVLNTLVCDVDVSRLSGEGVIKLQRVYRRVMELLPRIAFLGLSARTRLEVLKETESFVRGAANHAIILKHPELALELLEQGRAVFWSQYLRMRHDFESQGASHEIADQLRAIAQQLQREDGTTPDSGEASEQGRASTEAFAAEQRKLGVQFEALIGQVRSQPGCDRFLLPDTSEVLMRAADPHPVVVLLSSHSGCSAIVMRSDHDRPISVILSNITAEHLSTLNQRFKIYNSQDRGRLKTDRGRRMSMKVAKQKAEPSNRVLQELWAAVVQPIFQALDMEQHASNVPTRLHLCATGAFTHIPVHAACSFGQDLHLVQTFSQYAIPSYTPTLGILLASRQSLKVVRKSDVKVLLAAVRQGFQWQPLPYAKEEARMIRTIIPSQTIAGLLPTATSAQNLDTHKVDPTAGDVLHVLPSANILHLACHGYQNQTNPLASGFIMNDRMLTVKNLMALQLPNSLFAFLSACESAKGDEKQPDQAVHLAAALLFAGFKSVIGTMWSMNDVDGPVVAKHVYEKLFGGEGEFLDPEIIPRALDAAVRALRDRGVRPSRWAPYVHIGV